MGAVRILFRLFGLLYPELFLELEKLHCAEAGCEWYFETKRKTAAEAWKL